MQPAVSWMAVSDVCGLLCSESDGVLSSMAGAWKKGACMGDFAGNQGLL